MTEADTKRVEEIRNHWRFPHADMEWLLTQIEVLTFKVSNVTTERDVANAEITNITLQKDANAALAAEHRQEIKRLTAKAEGKKVEKLREALERSHCCATIDESGNCGGCFVSEALADTEGK